jgi:hypothetical protein
LLQETEGLAMIEEEMKEEEMKEEEMRDAVLTEMCI